MTDQLALFGVLGDKPARDAITSELDATLFVEAGAGTGKTRALVDRVVALVTGLAVPMPAIAAITFTEKAAAELRDRIRRALRDTADNVAEPEIVRARCRAAIDDLDSAAICTLHSFAQRILTEFPVEIGLPPRIEVRDEISSRIAFEARWRAFVDEMLDDPELEASILVLLAAGVKLPHLRTVAEVLDDNWDLLDRIDPPKPLPALRIEGWLDEVDGACAVGDGCRAGDDRLLGRLGDIAEYSARLRSAFDDAERIELLLAPNPKFNVGRVGNKKNWDDIDAVRDPLVKLGEQRKAMTDAVLDIAIKRVVAAIAVYIERSVAARRAEGALDFHDLLVFARTLLRDPEHGVGARARLWERYQRILIDEFQDTDPIQVELAALLGSDDPDDGSRPWNEMSVDPGRLFFVGDPKQSIYRFRRADIGTFLAAEVKFAQGAPRFLTCNFRTAPRVLGWINHVFNELIQPVPDSQPEYRPLDPARAVPAEHDRGVTLLGVEPHADAGINAGDLRAREAADVAAIARAAVAERWPVFDKELAAWRPARLGDVCILLPARTSLGYLERALGEAEVPYRAETSSLVYSSREVRDLLMTLRAVDDSSNTLALVAALRSSVFGCGDDDLFRFKVEHGGQWNVAAPLPSDLPSDDPVVAAIQFLAELHRDRVWSTPSELLERVVRERSVIEVGALTGRFRDVARRVRFLIDQARAYADAVGGTLRDYVAWAEMQGAEGARVVEAVVPETDDDAVRIMTVHGAKGLEFPIVVCSGMTTAAQVAGRGVELLFPPAGGYELKIVKGVQTAEFELHKPIDEQMGFHEKLRLLYVACTRARDHLVVSVHRKARVPDPDDRPHWTHAELLWHAAEHAEWSRLDRDPFAPTTGEPGAVAVPAPAPIDPDAWQAEYDRAHVRGNRRGFVSATTLAHRLDPFTGVVGGARPTDDDPGLAKDARDLELPPWNKGRYGTAIGRAVHATLQTIDLATGAGLEATVAAQAAAEGVLGHEATLAALTRAALASAVVARAAARPHWRETYVAVPFEGITLEGYVDLVYRDDDGLVVVDYKTDAVDADTRAERIAHYRVQAAAYALAVAEATGEPVVRGVLCFLEPQGATEFEFAGAELEAAVGEVRALLAAERDHPSEPPPLVPSDS
ncbi:MAG TPA: UvrD-helicase domain-containing protein [Acidimicrobiia bacterium]|nr:UvrD-helicase domain-containing protein [Acidimicrobiia bacterium]